jgi:hypothetical protein
MVSPSGWRALQQRVDFIVDGALGEPVILIPWLGGENYTPAEQKPDPSRKMIISTGMFVTPGAHLVGESGKATGGSGGGFGTQILEQECWLSITNSNIGDVTNWVAYDRVYFVDRDRFYNISYVEDSATLRPNVHLIREHDIATGQGSPIGQVTPTVKDALYFDTLGYNFYRSNAGSGPPDANGNAAFTANDWAGL